MKETLKIGCLVIFASFALAIISFVVILGALIFMRGSMNEQGEAYLWFLMSIGFFGVAIFFSVAGSVFAFIGRHKFAILITSLLGYIGLKVSKNSNIDVSRVNSKSIKEGVKIVNDVKRFFK